ncbi:YbaK/EbsC family protein [Desulfotomaculum copahuensis]|nr:YbaK/EbsC family protein [Desulfotomaculum copahuensis]
MDSLVTGAGGFQTRREMINPVERVRTYLARFPYPVEVFEFDASTHTAELAARAVGVAVGQIAKSILFTINDLTVMVVTSGDVKVSQSKLKKHLGVAGKVKLPDAQTTRELTGFPPGGVCPFALEHPVPILIDVSMKRFPVVYIAAGSPHSAAPVTVEQLLEITGGELCDLC